jgi:hypothetical protein
MVDNPFVERGLTTSYHPEVAGHVRDFVQLLRTGGPDPFTPEMAVHSLLMERAAELSARRKGALVTLDDPGIDEVDQDHYARARKVIGIDPMDIEAVVEFSFPTP